MDKRVKTVLQWLGLLLLLCVILAGTLAAYLIVDEYKPEQEEALEINGHKGEQVGLDKEYEIVSWNLGYGALGDNADFFMDGGKMVSSATEERVYYNLQGITEEVAELNPDFVLLQETDRKSTRSHFVDELQYLAETDVPVLGGQNAFACNFRVAFIPYPIPPIGRVEAGLVTFSSYLTDSATRVQLPIPFTWPLRAINLKRCLMVSRLPISGSDKELVLVNLHLEAYDDGSGKKAQTDMLRDILLEEVSRGNYVIAGGDFNQIFSSVDASAYPQDPSLWAPGVIDITEFEPDFEFYTDVSVPTCRSLDRPLTTAQSREAADFQYYIIDGFLVSSNIKVNEITTRDTAFEFADHNPVAMSFELVGNNN